MKTKDNSRNTRPYGTLTTDAEYLNLLTRKLFHSGFNKALVDKKWDAFEEVFFRFEPMRVARFDESDVLRLKSDSRIVRHRLKIRATIKNARHFVETAKTHGSWMLWLHSMRALPYEVKETNLHAVLTHCGPNTIFYFLLDAGEVDLNDKPHYVR